MSSFPLFDSPIFSAPEFDTHEKNLARVDKAINGIILAFLRSKGVGTTFSMVELSDYVKSRHSTAPDSAGRILRLMNQRGEIGYKLLSRSKSLYQITSVQAELESV